MIKKRCDYTVVGGGIIGCAIARELARRHKDRKIAILEKEDELLHHNSVRNSAVLHAGIYYKPGGMKALLCSRGNKLMKQFIKENKLWINEGGKLVIPHTKEESKVLEILYNQGKVNGVNVELLNKEQIKEIYPRVHFFEGFEKGLYTPDTAVGDLEEVKHALVKELKKLDNVEIMLGEEYADIIQDNKQNRITVRTRRGSEIESSKMINAGGHGCLDIAQGLGVALDKEMIYLKGYYLKTDKKKFREGEYPNCVIYPAPPTSSNIFLGVHTTTNQHYFKLGPTAIPVLSGTHYHAFSKLTLADAARTTGRYVRILFSKNGPMYVNLFASEVMKMLNKKSILDHARGYYDVPDNMKASDFHWDSSGIRTQLIKKSDKAFVTDFVFEENSPTQLHLLNFASPGWTCSFSIAEHVANKYIDK